MISQDQVSPLLADEQLLRRMYSALRDHFKEGRTCINCLNWSEQAQRCQLVNRLPPPRVIAKGCERWVDEMEIPF